MRITITCPTCNKKSQIDSSLRGKRLRCPYPDCKKPFRLSETGEAVSLDAPAVVEAPKMVDWQSTQATGSPGGWDMPAVADWQAAPPPQRGVEGESYESPVEQAWDGGGWQQPAEEAVEYTGEPEEYETDGEAVDYYAPVKKKKHSYYMLVAILIGIVGLAVGALAWVKIKEAAEAKAFAEAQRQYDAGHFDTSASKFKQLGDKFPDSPNAARYRYMEKLADLRASAGQASLDVDKAEDSLRKFHSEYRGKPLYKEYIEDIWLAAEGFVTGGYATVEKNPERAHLDKVRGAFDQILKDIGPSIKDQKIAESAYTKLEARYIAVNALVAQAEARKLLLAFLDDCMKEAHPSAVEKAQRRVEEDTAPNRYPKLANDAQIKAKLDRLKAAEPGWIMYARHNTNLPKPQAGPSEGTTLIVGPLVQGKPAAATANDPVVLSLSRGVLHAHTASTGELLWAKRVGVDTQILPGRIPARPPQPEIALVLATDSATDTATVTAVNVRTGEPRWVYPLGATCPAGPILAGRVAYFPTVERIKDAKGAVEERGKVHEIEVIDGKLLGVFDVGQPLTVPGSYDPVARRLFVPADRKRIYVLDVDGKKCVGVYYTNHTVGGLRAAPIVTPTTLVVAEANSVQSMVIKSFTLSETGDKETETPDKYRIRGWAWFSPFFDGDTLGYLTDSGALGLFGVKRGTRDEKAVILLGPPPDRSAGNLYGMPVGEQRGLDASSQAPTGQAQIAHVDLNEWWLLVGGNLYRYRFDMYRQQLVRVGGDPLHLGSPLQATQARGQYLVLGTQALDRNLLTALDRRTGAIAWQRQLGLITAQEPILLGGHLLAIDRTGGLFHMEPGKVPAAAKDAGSRISGPSAGDWLASGLPTSDPNSPPRLIASPDGQFALAALYAPAPVDKLTLRRYEPSKGIVSERTYRFDSPPLANSTPALNNHSVIIPCRDGNLRELPLAGTTELPVKLGWRHGNAPPDAPCHCLYLSDTQLIATDGLRSVGRWERGDDAEKRWRKTGNVEFNRRIVTPLVLVQGPQNEKLLGFGDSDGEITLYSMARGENVRSWRFENQQITKGPFLRGNHLGVVLDGNELVWIDPSKETPLWKKTFGELGMVGEPQVVGNHILVAETSGVYTWLDMNGKELGKNQLKSLIVPATAAVPFGTNQAFAPLSDGTVLILSPPGAPTARAD